MGARCFPHLYMLQFALARTLLFNGETRSALAILDTLTILPFEGARYGHEAYRAACLIEAARSLGVKHSSEALRFIAKARTWPERLGGGKPYEVDERLEDLLAAIASGQMGDVDGQRAALGHIVARTREHPGEASPFRLVGALALRSLGTEPAGSELIRTWPPAGDELNNWASLMYAGASAEAHELEERLRTAALHRSRGNQEWVLLTEVFRTLAAAGITSVSLQRPEIVR
jgi:hypothetical protein